MAGEENNRIIAEIEAALDSNSPIPADEVRRWMQAQCLDTWGALSIVFFDHAERIQPPLDMQTVCDFMRKYYKRCLSEAVDGGKYYPSRYIAGHELQNWFKRLWEDHTVPRGYVDDLKAMLTELYLSGDAEVQECVVNSVLEHLFETPEFVQYFSEWKQDSTLKVAYESAMQWANDPPDKRQPPA